MEEFCAYARAAKPTEETPHIEECIQMFNGLTIWVLCNILRELTIVKRAVIVEKFMDCTKVALSVLLKHKEPSVSFNSVCSSFIVTIRCWLW